MTLFLLSASGSLQAKKTKQYFQERQITVDITITHPIEVGNFVMNEVNSAAQILIIGERKTQHSTNKVQVAQLFTLIENNIDKSSKYEKTHEIILPDSTAVIDFYSDTKGRKKVLLLDSKGLWDVDFKTDTVRFMTQVSSLYIESYPQFIALKKLSKDYNGDGLDDIFIQDFKNSTLFLQQTSGEFVRQELPIQPLIDVGQQIAFSDTRVFNVDVNFDQHPDLVTLKNNQLYTYQQLKKSTFSTQVTPLALDMSVSEKPWWQLKTSDGDIADQSQINHRMLETIEDINGDGIADLMVKVTQSSGVLDRSIKYEIYYGFNAKGLLTFKHDSDTSITAEGTLGGLELIDMDGDAKKEILVSSFDIGVGQIIGALISGSIDQDVYLFRLDANDKYIKKPIFEKEVDLKFSLSSGKSGQAVILAADVNGDGIKEMLLSNNDKRLSIFMADETSHRYKSRKKRHTIKIPTNGSMVKSAKLTNNEKESLIIRYGKQDKNELRNQVVILSK